MSAATEPNPDAPAGMPYEPNPDVPAGMPYEPNPDVPAGMPYEPNPDAPAGMSYDSDPGARDGMSYRSDPGGQAGVPYGLGSQASVGMPDGSGSGAAAGVPDEPDSDAPAGMPDPRISAIPVAARGLQGRRAGLISRLLANTVDLGVVVGIVAAGYAGIAALRFLWNSRTFTFPAPGFGPLVLIGSLVLTLYLTAGWTAAGRTYGDHLLGLRVVGRRGRPLRRVTAFLRAVLCVVFPIGLFWIVISRDNRSVQDLLLRSSVVYDWSRAPLTRSGGS